MVRTVSLWSKHIPRRFRPVPVELGVIVANNTRKGKTEMKKISFVTVFVLLFVPLSSHAQGLGSIVGRVNDPAGASVAGAQVTATQEGTGFPRRAPADAGGRFTIPSLPPAPYIL